MKINKAGYIIDKLKSIPINGRVFNERVSREYLPLRSIPERLLLSTNSRGFQPSPKV